MEWFTGPEKAEFEITVDRTDRFSVGKGCWGPHGPTRVVAILDDTRMIVRPIRTFFDLQFKGEDIVMPAKSKAQYRFMKAIESGDLKKKGLSKEKAKEFTKGQSPTSLPEKKAKKKK